MNCPACGAANIEGADQCESCQEPLTDLKAPKRGLERRILEGTIADLSPKPAVLVKPGQSLAEAVATMRRSKVGCALVVENGRLEGIVSEREILLSDALSGPAAAVMRPNPTVLREDDQVAEVFNRMAMSGHLHVPIEGRDGSFKVVSARDLLRYLCK